MSLLKVSPVISTLCLESNPQRASLFYSRDCKVHTRSSFQFPLWSISHGSSTNSLPSGPPDCSSDTLSWLFPLAPRIALWFASLIPSPPPALHILICSLFLHSTYLYQTVYKGVPVAVACLTPTRMWAPWQVYDRCLDQYPETPGSPYLVSEWVSEAVLVFTLTLPKQWCSRIMACFLLESTIIWGIFQVHFIRRKIKWRQERLSRLESSVTGPKWEILNIGGLWLYTCELQVHL